MLQANGFGAVRTVSHPAARFRALVAAAPPPPPRPPRLGPDNVRELLWAPALGAPLPVPGGAPAPAAAAATEAAEPPPRAPPNALLALEWRAAYGALCADAHELGIPASVIPRLPDDDAELSLELLQERQRHLQDMVASFLSSGL
jgi:hypothetical protein